MASFVLRRLVHSIVVVFAVSFVVFVLIHVSGDPLAVVKGSPGTSRETVDRIIERHHLDEPVLSQYGHWLRSIVTDGFGRTLLSQRPIAPDLFRAFGNTAQLVPPALVLGAVAGIVLGALAAVRRDSLFDYGAMTLTSLLLSMPQFWIALLLQVLFTNLYLDTGIRIFYTSGLSSGGNGILLDRSRHLALPVLVLSFTILIVVARFVRASVLDVLREEFVRVARAKGLSERRILYRHVLRAALPPVVTLVAATLPLLFGEAVIIETVFSIDGFGRYFVRAIEARDVYPVMASLVLISVLTTGSSLAADIAHASLDHRVRPS
jgi:ABC-type dipeptide/oligopeptide/nickel transport system permease component